MKFYLLGDMGSGEESQITVANALSKNIGKKKNVIVCGLGDNIYENGVSCVNDKQFIEKFEKPYENISNEIPFYMCLGNHDYGYSNLSLKPSKNAECQVKYSQKSEKWKMPDKYYTYKKGEKGKDVEFFVLDTNIDMMSKKEIDKQLKYMKNKIKRSNAKWKVLYGHHTWRSNAGHGNAEPELEEFFNKLLNDNPCDLYICGHDHNKQLIDYNFNGDIIRLIVCGTGGKVYDDMINFNNMDDKCDLQFSSNNLGFGMIDVFKNKLNVSFFDENNNLEYIHEIKKY